MWPTFLEIKLKFNEVKLNISAHLSLVQSLKLYLLRIFILQRDNQSFFFSFLTWD